MAPDGNETNLSKYRIIMIHGLASKPPQKVLDDYWSKCILENIRIEDPALAKTLASSPTVFDSAYWANATPHHIEDDANYCRKLGQKVDEVIQERKSHKQDFHVGTGERVGAFFKDRGADLAKLIAGALTVKDDVMKAFMAETRLYSEDQYIADKMRRPLEDALRKAWDEGCEVALLSHSMGTFISYDVLWRFSHRSEKEFRKYSNKRVKMFVTMGSPLGDTTVREILFSRAHEKHGARLYPTNIDYWHNYACLGDVVSHYHDFNTSFFEPMRDLGLLPKSPKYRAIDYANLHNPFEVVTHKENKKSEKRNPHKSYGYLVQPRLGTWLVDFLRGKVKS